MCGRVVRPAGGGGKRVTVLTCAEVLASAWWLGFGVFLVFFLMLLMLCYVWSLYVLGTGLVSGSRAEDTLFIKTLCSRCAAACA